MAKKQWFIVKKAGRVVDAVRAADIGLAMQAALDVWEKAAEKSGHLLEVEPMPVAVTPKLRRATREEIKLYSGGAGDVPVVHNPVFNIIFGSGAK